jgi:hypothetical protein
LRPAALDIKLRVARVTLTSQNVWSIEIDESPETRKVCWNGRLLVAPAAGEARTLFASGQLRPPGGPHKGFRREGPGPGYFDAEWNAGAPRSARWEASLDTQVLQ